MIAEFAFEHGYIKGGGQRLPYWIKKIVVLHGFSILRQSRGCESYFFLHCEHPNVPRFVQCFAVGMMTETSPAGEVLVIHSTKDSQLIIHAEYSNLPLSAKPLQRSTQPQIEFRTTTSLRTVSQFRQRSELLLMPRKVSLFRFLYGIKFRANERRALKVRLCLTLGYIFLAREKK